MTNAQDVNTPSEAKDRPRDLQYGKSFAEALCKRLERSFREQLDARVLKPTADTSYTLPVFFNAWCHESEDHLIVPLLKTTQHTLSGWLEQHDDFDEQVTKVLKTTVATLKNAALALASGLKGKLALPLVGELEVEPKAMLEAYRQCAN